jgi:uncharacterized membrane protein YeaQ/YmgE (transglycosylase-associated protein family)
VKNRSWSLTADVDPKGGESGVIATQGGLFGGWALYFEKGKRVFSCRQNRHQPSHLAMASRQPAVDCSHSGMNAGADGPLEIHLQAGRPGGIGIGPDRIVMYAAGSAGVSTRRRNRMELIITLVIGGVIGWLASIVMKTNAQMGMIANIVVGIVGAWLGSWLAVTLGIAAQGVGSYVVSIVGAMVLIGLLKVIGVFK